MPKASDMQHKKDNNSRNYSPSEKKGVESIDSNNRSPEPSHSQMLMSALTWMLVVSSVIYLWAGLVPSSQPTISYSQFKQQLLIDNVEHILLENLTIQGRFRVPVNLENSNNQSHQTFKSLIPSFGDTELLALLEANKVDVEAITANSPVWLSIILSTAPWLVLIAFFVYSSKMLRNTMGGKDGGMGFSKSRAKHYEADKMTTCFDDVAGLENAKRDLQEIIGYLKNPDHYRQLGAKMPKGILMMGPPGCGKTLLARATAGEAGVPFFSVSGSEFIEMFVGVGASRVRDMFRDARKQAPALIFIDEIDSVGRVRGTGMGGGNDEREQTLNQILAEMDGFSVDEAVVVLAATNRPDILDPALLRPGRFDRKLVLELPGRQARADILAVHTRKVPLSEDVNIVNIAAETIGFSGADLANLVNEAALRAARNNTATVSSEDFSEARDKIVMGDAQGELLVDSEKERVAYHEAGHALTAFFSGNADPIVKVSIIPRGRALGMTEQRAIEDRHNYPQQYLQERLCIMLGGRVAEQLQFGEVSSGAADDLKNATVLARKMVTQWGMSERIGAVNLQQSEEHPFLGREMAEPKIFSEYSAQVIDEEISAMIFNCEETCRKRLSENSHKLTRLAQNLIERESLTGEDIAKLFSVS